MRVEMMAVCVCLGLVVGAARAEPAAPVDPAGGADRPVVVLETSLGTIKAELWPDKAPKTVANFLRYADEKFYDGLIFHRVIAGFMIQGGGFDADMIQRDTHAPVKNEARTDTPNVRGTLAMARTMQVDSATAQFFINLVDNVPLNHRDESPRGFGYCVFGKVVEGLDVVDRIGAVETGTVDKQLDGPPFRARFADVPKATVTIKTVRRVQTP